MRRSTSPISRAGSWPGASERQAGTSITGQVCKATISPRPRDTARRSASLEIGGPSFTRGSLKIFDADSRDLHPRLLTKTSGTHFGTGLPLWLRRADFRPALPVFCMANGTALEARREFADRKALRRLPRLFRRDRLSRNRKREVGVSGFCLVPISRKQLDVPRGMERQPSLTP